MSERSVQSIDSKPTERSNNHGCHHSRCLFALCVGCLRRRSILDGRETTWMQQATAGFGWWRHASSQSTAAMDRAHSLIASALHCSVGPCMVVPTPRPNRLTVVVDRQSPPNGDDLPVPHPTQQEAAQAAPVSPCSCVEVQSHCHHWFQRFCS